MTGNSYLDGMACFKARYGPSDFALRNNKPSEVLQQYVAFGCKDVDGAQKELVRRQDAGGLDGEDEVVLALAQLQVFPPLLLPRHPPHLQPQLCLSSTAQLLCNAKPSAPAPAPV